MTTRQKLEQRLSKISEPAVASADHKLRLRNELKRRVARRRSTASRVTVLAVVLVFSTTLLHETPLESINNEFGVVDDSNDIVSFMHHEDSRGGLAHGRAVMVDGRLVQTPMTTDEIELVRTQQETFANLHAAGMTHLKRVSGYTVFGERHLVATYTATIDSEQVTSTYPIDEAPMSPEHRERIIEFTRTAYVDYLIRHSNHQTERRDTIEMEIDGVLRPVARSFIQDEEYGDIIIWLSEYPDKAN